jgi:hypothetical protein
MRLRPSEPQIVEDSTYEKVRFIVQIDGSPIRYYDARAEAEAFVDGFNYIWVRD